MFDNRESFEEFERRKEESISWPWVSFHLLVALGIVICTVIFIVNDSRGTELDKLERYETVSEQPFIVINDYVLNIEDHVSEDELGLLIEDGLNDKVYSTMNPLNGDDEKSTKIVGTSKSIGEMLLDSNMAGSVYLYNNDTKYRYRISVNIDSKEGANSSVLNQEIKLLENNNKIWFERVDEPDKIQIFEISHGVEIKPEISLWPFNK